MLFFFKAILFFYSFYTRYTHICLIPSYKVFYFLIVICQVKTNYHAFKMHLTKSVLHAYNLHYLFFPQKISLSSQPPKFLPSYFTFFNFLLFFYSPPPNCFFKIHSAPPLFPPCQSGFDVLRQILRQAFCNLMHFVSKLITGQYLRDIYILREGGGLYGKTINTSPSPL